MTGDDWYVDGVRAADDLRQVREREADEKGRQKLLDAGAGETIVDSYDVASMYASGVPMDGTYENRYARKAAKFVDRFDASDAEPVTPSPMEIRLEGLRGAAMAAGAVAGTGVYEFGRNFWNFSADVYEAMGGSAGVMPRPPSAAEVGIPEPEGLPAEVGAGLIEHGLAFGNAFSALRNLATIAPRSMAGRVALGTAQSAGAGAAADVISDPTEDSIYSMLRSAFALEGEVARAVDPALLYEEEPIAGRAAMVAEGVVAGAALGAASKGALELGSAVVRGIYARADDLERLAVGALSRVRAQVVSGLDESQLGWLSAWMAAKMMKGTQRLSPAFRDKLRDVGATDPQIVSAWNRAATIRQRAASDRLLEMRARFEADAAAAEMEPSP